MQQDRTIGTDWPLVGRIEELGLLDELRNRRVPVSAIISGPPGVGKSRLARAALANAHGQGWSTLVVRGSAGFGAVPLGPFRTILQLPNSSELADLTASVAQELMGMRTAKGLVLLVDDAQNLDESSSGLLHQLVAGGLIVAIITARAGSSPPALLTDLWKDGFAERIELQQLSLRETTELLVAGIGGLIQDSSAKELWRMTGGNPLYLREVVLSSAESGALQQIDGEWRWRGDWATGTRLQEIVAARLGRLDPDELTVMEMLALAGPLPLDLISGLATGRAVAILEERALVATERNGRRLDVAIAHPLHAEVLRSGMSALQQRSMRRNLVDALRATGARRAVDRVRLACWSLESGVDVDLMTLTLASDASLIAVGHAISARLQEILPIAAVELPADGPAVPQDFEVAIRLAQTAYERSGELREGAALASTLAWTGATDRAEAVIAELAGKAQAIDDRLRLAQALGWVRFWGRYHVDEARDGLLEAAAGAGAECDPALISGIFEQLAGIALNTAQPAAAYAYAEQAATAQGVELYQCVAAPAAAAALTFLGRCADAISLVDQAMPVAYERGERVTVATLLFTRAGALLRMGDLEAARQLTEWLRDVALEEGLVDAAAIFGVLLGEVLLRQGRPASAVRIFRDCSGLMSERDVFGYRPWALAGVALAKALAGEEDSAAAALSEAKLSQPIGRHFDMSRCLAEVELHTLAGRSAEAVSTARAGVLWARANGMVIEEALALDAWVRVAPSSELAERLAETASLTDSQFITALAAHATAVVARDPDGLLAVSEQFAGMTAWWLATEAASEAARIFDRRNEAKSSKAAARAIARFAAHCESMRRLAPDGEGRLRLTKREREIATLAAAGRSTKEIAARMYLSPRTVENHLYHAYAKLGVTDRSELAEALASRASE